MKKRIGKLKRFIAMLLVGVTLSSSVLYSYTMPVQASAVLPAAQTIVEALMTLFGYSLGFGKSTNGFSASSSSSVINAAIDSALNEGGVVNIGNYGSVDFNDGNSVLDLVNAAYRATSTYLAGETYNKLLAAYDYESYKTSGVSATKAMHDTLGKALKEAEDEQGNADTQKLLEGVDYMLRAIAATTSNGSGGNNEDPNKFNGKTWLLFGAILTAALTFDDYDSVDWNTVSTLEDAVDFAEYVSDDLILPDDGFSGWTMADGAYTACVYYNETWKPNILVSHLLEVRYFFSSNAPFFAYTQADGTGYVICHDGISANYESYYCSNGNSATTTSYSFDGPSSWSLSCNFADRPILFNTVPLFSSQEAGLTWLENPSVTNDMLNYVSIDSVNDFVSSVPSSAVAPSISTYMDTQPTAAEVVDLADSFIDNDAFAVEGTTAFDESVAAVVEDATNNLPAVETEPVPTTAPDIEVEPEVDPDAAQTSYLGLLTLILNAINAIAESVWSFFENPFEGIATGIESLIELVPGCFELVRGWIEALPSNMFYFFEVPLLTIQQALAALNPLETWWPRLQSYLDRFLDLLNYSVPEPDIDDPNLIPDDEDGNGKHSFDLLTLLNGLWLIILILLMLLSIFLHLMVFIINIFKIPAAPGFLNENMVMAIDYLKALEIAGMGISVYDFMFGLIYILMVFGVVKVLRHNIDHFKLPKMKNGGM